MITDSDGINGRSKSSYAGAIEGNARSRNREATGAEQALDISVLGPGRSVARALRASRHHFYLPFAAVVLSSIDCLRNRKAN